jgi:TolB-like protein/Tfp pilus assembly protein PilF
MFEPAPIGTSIGVVPFENDSGETAQEALADGLTEDIVAQLSKISGLSVYRFKGIEETPQAKAAELGVANLLEGKIRRVGGKIRISTQLLEARSDRVLWSENYDRELTDVFALQTEISLEVAKALQVELLPGERTGVGDNPTDSIEAYDLYLQGRYLRHTQENPVGLHQAVNFFKRAIEKDREYALAYAGLAECYFMLASIYGVEPWEKFGEAAKLAVQYGETLPEPHVAMGLWNDFREDDEAAADANFTRALELDPRHSNARREYARFLMRRGRFEEALIEIEKVHDPMFAVTVHLTRAETYRYRGEYDEAMQEAHRFREIWTGSDEPLMQMVLCYMALAEYEKAEQLAKKISANYPAHYRLLALIYLLQGRMEEATEAGRQLIALQPDTPFSWWVNGYIAFLERDLDYALDSFERAYQLKTKDDLNWWRPYATYLGVTYWKQGKKDKAEQLFAERIALNESAIEKGNQNPEIRKDMAVIFATRGDKEEALRWLELAALNGYALYDLTLRDGLLDNLHDEPRFQKLIAEMETRVSEMRNRVARMEAEWNQ